MKQELKFEELRSFLDEKVEQFNRYDFIDNDPIQIPHRFQAKEDIEISSFLTSTISWGKRIMIIKNANRMMQLMDESPYDFVMNHSDNDLRSMKNFVHRTFNGEDLVFFIRSLKKIYSDDGMERIFLPKVEELSMKEALGRFNKVFFLEADDKHRTRKHVANPLNGSSAKRLNMFLRWMVRNNDTGVDFGIWNKIPTSKLSCPLDVHTGNVGRMLNLLSRKQNDWKAVAELDGSLRKMDPIDPVKYDFALFGLGVEEGWK